VLRQAFADAIDIVTRTCGGAAEIVHFPATGTENA
jgi:hypothetical protein